MAISVLTPASDRDRNVVAVLGPTNTGKTHTAVERMLGHASGMIGFPLRLLAREVYDRVVSIKGPTRVALITGEEKIVPDNPAYYLCTAESMPLDKDVGFVGIDEVQLAADFQRGHIFTDRLLRARGTNETMLMGSDTIRPLIRQLIPDAEIKSRPRYSELTYAKPRKLSRLPRRSAIIAFSAEEVYAVAELLRRQKGGAAIVMGALSPRTRNAQVELYQSGEVDYLVATDAIGMGLNMDIDHVVFASTRKFDGRLMRNLHATELAQIAGRAGRHMNNGSFSVLAGNGANGNGPARAEAGLDPLVVAQIEDHAFEPLKTLMWRNPSLAFDSPRALSRSLDARPDHPALSRAPEAVDQTILHLLSDDSEVLRMLSGRENVRRLWDACQIPDFRKISIDDHAALVKRIFRYRVSGEGEIPHDWIARQVSHLDNVQGDIDTLAQRIAGIRIWTYVAHRHGWLAERAHWEHVTKSVEDKLSDALHERLMQRFVDRRTAVLMRELKQKGDVFVAIDKDNTISVEGHEIGLLKGFTFQAQGSADASERKMLNNAAERALKTEVEARVAALATADDGAFGIRFDKGSAPRITWQDADIAMLTRGDSPLRPRVKLLANTMLTGETAERVRIRLDSFVATHIADLLDPLVRLEAELAGAPAPESAAPLDGLCRGVAFRLVENLGVMRRVEVDAEMRQIDQEARRGLRRFGIRIGMGSLFMPKLLKPKPTALRLVLWALFTGQEEFPEPPTPGMVWTDMDKAVPPEFYTLAGFQPTDAKAIRVDMLERLADEVRPLGRSEDGKSKVFETTPEIMGLVGLSGDDFVAAMRAIGYRRAPTPEATATVPPSTAPKATVPAADPAPGDPPADDSPPAERLFFRWQPQSPVKRRKPVKYQDRSSPDRKAKRARPVKDAPGRHLAQGKHARRAEKQPDPNSPFAALQGLKDAMRKKPAR